MKNDIAVVGMACRFPGADDHRAYWELLSGGRHAVAEIPADRWKWADFAGNPATERNKTNSRWGGFVTGVDEFDPLFFGISPAEARYIDPQHRLFLQTAYHAVEDAGYDIRELAGRRVGVYAGVSKNDYAELMRESGVDIESFVSTGTVHSILANRVSFLFDLRASSEVVDTACSSFLVALHHAVRDLRLGVCESAVVGGVNLILSPTMYVSHGKSGMLSGTGACRAFDKGADGYVRGEGVGVVYVKRLEDALLARDHVWGVIKGIAVSHGGRSNFLTAPRASSQADTLREALTDGDIDPASVSYFETHGTGTPLGDPVEFSGIKAAYGGARSSEASPCYLSSVKTNIGHLESAASAAGLIKVLLGMKHGLIPRMLHFKAPNPLLRIEGTRFSVAETNIEWTDARFARRGPRRAALSSFGMGGVNAHLVVETPPRQIEREAAGSVDRRPTIIPLSAESREQLDELLVRFHRFLDDTDVLLEDLAFTLQNGRHIGRCRICFVADNTESLRLSLDTHRRDPGTSGAVSSAGAPSAEADLEPSRREALELARRWVEEGGRFPEREDAARSGCRISLPGYPFARRRCWFPVNDRETAVAGEAEPSVRTHETARGTRERRTDPNEVGTRFLHDHVVQGTAILPAALYLKWLADRHVESGAEASLRISDVSWLAPCRCDAYDEAGMDVSESVGSEGTSLAFESAGRPRCSATIERTMSDPSMSTPWSAEPLEAGETLDVEAVYAELARSGLDYGPAFRVIRQATWVDDTVSVQIERGSTGAADSVEVVVPVLDAVFQAVVLLHNRTEAEDPQRQHVPFMLERLDWRIRALPSRCVARARRCPAKGDLQAYDMELCTQDGALLCAFHGFVKRPYAVSRHTTDAPSDDTAAPLLYHTTWIECPPGTRGETPSRLRVYSEGSIEAPGLLAARLKDVVVYSESCESPSETLDVDGVADDIASRRPALATLIADADLGDAVVYLASRQDEGADDAHQVVLAIVQAAQRRKEKRFLDILYVHGTSDEPASRAAIVAGFGRTLKYENPDIRVRTLGLDERGWHDWQPIVLSETEAYDNSLLCEIRHVDGVRQIRSVRDLDHVPNDSDRSRPPTVPLPDQPVIKEGGHYLIAGGAGEIGVRFAEYLTSEFGASVHLVGRRELGAPIERILESLRTLGGTATYWRCDISDADATQALFDRIADTGAHVDGILQCAGLIEDAFIFNKSPASFDRVLAPKVAGTINLDRASIAHQPDFMVLFSSVAALMPNQGQCDYAGANSFLDRYAITRNRLADVGSRSGRCVAINWPLWANGGITVSPAEETHLRDVFGMSPMTWESARSVLDRVLRFGTIERLDSVVAIEGSARKIRASLNVIGAEEHPRLGSLELLAKEPGHGVAFSRSALGSLVESTLLEITRVSRSIDLDANLSAVGFDSAAFAVLAERINVMFGTEVDPLLFFERNTIRQLTEYLELEALSSAGHAGRDFGTSTARPSFRGLLDVVLCDKRERRFRKRLSHREFFMRDHVVQGRYNVPGACFVEMAIQAFALERGYDPALHGLAVRNNYWAKQLSTSGPELRLLVTLGDGRAPGLASYRITCEGDAASEVYAMGDIELLDAPRIEDAAPGYQGERSARRSGRKVDFDEIYRFIQGQGLLVGDTFKPMSSAHVSEETVSATCRLPESVLDTSDDYVLHPTLFTGVLQAALLNNGESAGADDRYIPLGVDEIIVDRPSGTDCHIETRVRALANDRSIRKFDARVFDEAGRSIASFKGITLRNLTHSRAAEVHMDTTNPADARVAERDLAAVRHLLGDIIAESVGLAPEEIAPAEQLDRYGLNSILIVELNGKLEDVFGSLSKTLLFEYQTVEALAEYFVEHHRPLLMERKVIGESGVEIGSPAATIPSGASDGTDPATRDSTTVRVAGLPTEAPTAAPGHAVARNDDVAIVGLAGRYPGASDVETFWENLVAGRDCITATPDDRFDIGAHGDRSDVDLRGCLSGGFLDDVERFDAALFNISPREAEKLDPQERLFLETAWTAVENAGYDHEALRGQRIGVFVGALWQPYTCLGVEETQKGNEQTPNGLLYNIPNRVSYFFDWCGPSLVVDTACSGSLTALHLACNSIRSGEVVAALAGGVNLSFSSSKYLWLAKNNFLSSDCRCRSFGEGGDGYVPGEGVGAVYLKRLSDALSDGDHIHGVIRATSVNHGGRTNGFTVPNPSRQGEMIRESLDRAGIDARSISYVEAHGTGTALGDPIEITGLTRAFEPDAAVRASCAIGSVKSNIGHLEAAAGIAGLTKTLLQMKHRLKVPSLHADRENPNVSLGDTAFYLQKNVEAWIETGRPHGDDTRIAMVSSFGAGGSNAHLVVAEFPKDRAPGADISTSPVTLDPRAVVFPFSARTDVALDDYLRVFAGYLRACRVPLHDIAYTLQEGRATMGRRAAFVARSIGELTAGIEQFLAGRTTERLPLADDTAVEVLGESDLERLIRDWTARGDLAKVVKLWEAGHAIDWQVLSAKRQFQRVALPTYRFERQPYRMKRVEDADHPRRSGDELALTTVLDESTGTGYSIVNRSSLFRQAFELHPIAAPPAAGDPADGISSGVAPNALREALGEICRIAADSSQPYRVDRPAMACTDGNETLDVEVEPLLDGDGDLSGLELRLSVAGGGVVSIEALPADGESGSSAGASSSPAGRSVDRPHGRVLRKPTGVVLKPLPGHDDRVFDAPREAGSVPEAEGGLVETAEPGMAALKESLARCLFMEVSDIDERRSFSDIGLDSIVGVEWIETLNASLGTNLQASVLYDHPSLERLRGYLDRLPSGDDADGQDDDGRVSDDDTDDGGADRVELPASAANGRIPLERISRVLIDELANVLYMDRGAVRSDSAFVDLGLDSVVGIEWLDSINRELGTRLPATTLYEFPSVDELARHVHESRRRSRAAPAPTDTPTTRSDRTSTPDSGSSARSLATTVT